MWCFRVCFYATSVFVNQLFILWHKHSFLYNNHFILHYFRFQFNYDHYGDHLVNVLELHKLTVNHHHINFIFDIHHSHID